MSILPDWTPAAVLVMALVAIPMLYLINQINQLRRGLVTTRRVAREEVASEHRMAELERQNQALQATLHLIIRMRPDVAELMPRSHIDALSDNNSGDPPRRLVVVTANAREVGARKYTFIDPLDVQRALEPLRRDAPWAVKVITEASAADIGAVLDRGGAHVVMFVCHGTAAGEILLEGGEVVTQEWLADQVQYFRVQGVAFAVCHSQGGVSALLSHGASWVLYADGLLPSEALAAVVRFLQRLAGGASAGDAYAYARASLRQRQSQAAFELSGDYSWRWQTS